MCGLQPDSSACSVVGSGCCWRRAQTPRAQPWMVAFPVDGRSLRPKGRTRISLRPGYQLTPRKEGGSRLSVITVLPETVNVGAYRHPRVEEANRAGCAGRSLAASSPSPHQRRTYFGEEVDVYKHGKLAATKARGGTAKATRTSDLVPGAPAIGTVLPGARAESRHGSRRGCQRQRKDDDQGRRVRALSQNERDDTA